MKTREYRTIAKTDWPRGEWDFEPDKKQWQDPATGLPCLIVRNIMMGNLCGYVGVGPKHPLYRIGYGQCYMGYCKEEDRCEHTPEAVLDAHGGINFANVCHTDAPEEQGICHRVDPGESDDVWWFGFDCGHAFDFIPSLYMRDMKQFGINLVGDLGGRIAYRNWVYVESEVTNLARQLKELER